MATTANRRGYAVGLDYGTNSARAVVVDLDDGRELAAHVFPYRRGEHGVVVSDRDPHLARQHPADYVEGFVAAVGGAVKAARKIKTFDPARVVGLGVDTTGSTPIPVDRDGTPLALLPQFADNPDAMAWLWKDHTAWKEAAAITKLAAEMKLPYLDKCGGVYSSEWFWSKIWRCRIAAPAVFRAAYSWVELCDFVPAWACGQTNPATLRRSVCAAGHKAMYHPAWGGLPSAAFLKKLHPDLAQLRARLYETAVPSNEVAGRLAPDVAKKVGLPAGIVVAVGAFDAHHGAVGAGIRPGVLVKVIGTSTCDMAVAPAKGAPEVLPGVCGLVPGSILPGLVGVEAGQSAVGDIFNWFARGFSGEKSADDAHARLNREAAALAPGQSGLLALDWNNGNRTILVDPRLSGLLLGQTLRTTPGEVYRALVEATAFGARAIVERMEEYGVPVKTVVNCGGIAEKSSLVMQIYADVLNRPMRISRSSQTCALGAALFGGVAAGAYKTVEAAQKAMCGVKEKAYAPNAKAVRVYNELYGLYHRLHDAFGGVERKADLGGVMKKLLELQAKSAQR